MQMGNLREAIKKEAAWTTTENGADALNTTGSACLDMFGRAGAMRQNPDSEKEIMISRAYTEDPDMAVKLLFYTRDIRGGYGEKDTFKTMIRRLADINKQSVEKNIWAILEFGCAKDLYSLIGTPCEDAMWAFMQAQFNLDYANMQDGKSVSLLAKWIATPDSKSEKTKKLGKETAKHLGYSFKTMSEYKKKLRALRKYLDLPEAKMCAGKWDEIEYSKCSSKFLLKNRNAFKKHDGERWEEYTNNVASGEAKMNMGTVNPCEILHKVAHNYSTDLEAMWKALPNYCEGNALVMADTSGSMCGSRGNAVEPIEVALSLAMYFAERCPGDLHNLFMTFSTTPAFVEMDAGNLRDNFRKAMRAPWDGSTNLEMAFDLLLNTCINGNVAQEDMPKALIVISDMEINGGWSYSGGSTVLKGVEDNRITFYDAMAKKYADAGYEMPQVVFWNVASRNATFHASHDTKGVSLVSGYSPVVFKQVMDNIGVTPYELMLRVVTDPRYADVKA